MVWPWPDKPDQFLRPWPTVSIISQWAVTTHMPLFVCGVISGIMHMHISMGGAWAATHECGVWCFQFMKTIVVFEIWSDKHAHKLMYMITRVPNNTYYVCTEHVLLEYCMCNGDNALQLLAFCLRCVALVAYGGWATAYMYKTSQWWV